jgi:transposase
VNEGISGIKQDIFRHGRLRKEYFAILRKTDKEEPAPEKGAKGRVKATKGRNLMIRLREHAAAVFAFALHIEVSFTNNQAERDLRPVKLKIKVAGCFRNPAFAQHWATIQSCISTARKQGINPYEMIREALRGQHLTLC